MGFRPTISTTDNTFTIGQILENCYEHNTDLHIILVDYTRDFDAVYRNKITEYLVQYKVTTKLVRPIELTLINTTTVTVKNGHTEVFKVTWNKTRKSSICNFI
jgi:hypothetical protein